MDILKLVVVALIGYLMGSANTSIIVGKFYGIDVRLHGSGNAGATNTLRTLGKGAAALVGIGDVLKGVLSCLIGMFIAGDIGLMLGGLAAVIGHNWPVYFGFKGGKGIFTSFSVVLMMDWKLGLMLLGVFIIIVAVTRYISLGSMICSALFPVIGFLFKKPLEFVVFAAILAVLAVVRHRGNIQRILNGTESKFGSKKA
ncbi:MAG: glycerol-3-phosphate 1-O-acyltransferase PlsY [Clostridia bacterium]|nr:glycerol-3-phosphate 1-O-acyltransferase PlsY [Clostridia bacterium]